MLLFPSEFFHLCLMFLLHPRSPAAPPAGHCVCTERSVPASGRLLGHLQWPAQCAVPALRDRDHAGAATPAAAETRSVPAQHRPQGGLHSPAADPGHQHWVQALAGVCKPNPTQRRDCIKSCVFPWVYRTYADKLSPKVVQSLLDLLCSQLKNLLSQAGVSLLSSGNEQDNKKHEDSVDSEKKDLRGDKELCLSYRL